MFRGQRFSILAVLCLALPFVAVGIAMLADGTLPPGTSPANEGAFEGGNTGTYVDAGENINISNFNDGGGGFDIPTGASASPLFGARAYRQQLLRFEELGPESMHSPEETVPHSFPLPLDGQSGPDTWELDTFLGGDLFPYPTREANYVDWNPWQTYIESMLGRPLINPPAEGRAPGESWSHQRWDEFYPQTYFQSAAAGARINLGLRDEKQLHAYSVGEFGPGGLYHNTVGASGFNGTTSGIDVRFHPQMPIQEPNSLWTFDGTFPPKLLNVRYGEPLLYRMYNALPIDPAANMGFGLHTITIHEHNGHSPAESDGYTQAFFFPGQYFDYRWPLVLAGNDSINTGATDDRAGAPDGAGGIRRIPGDYRETMSTHWFHDHMLDFTAQNVYKGIAAAMNYYSSIDRGREPASALEAVDGGGMVGYGCHYADPSNVNLCLPSGSGLDWGNRDYDVNLLIADRAWDQDGQLFFNIFNTDGFMGDRILTNWLWNPYMKVRARRYRFRLLNGSVSRYFRFALVTDQDERVPFHMIANDGNIMEHAIYFENGEMPTQGIAERYDIIVDFGNYDPGTRIYMVNLLEHDDGKGPKQPIPLEDVLSGDYRPRTRRGQWRDGDPGVGKFLQFRVKAHDEPDLSMNPADYVPGGKKMIPLPGFTAEELANARHRRFEFGRSSGTDEKPWTIKTDGGAGFGMDPRRLSAAPSEGDVEIWHVENGGGGWSHPVHIHFEEGQIIQRGGQPPPVWEQWARKDVYRVGDMDDSLQSVDIALRFREFLGTYMEHCHNTQHEDHSMLLRWDIENPGELLVMPTPMPTWDGVTFVDSVTLPTFRTGDTGSGGGDDDDDDDDGDDDDGGVNNPPVADDISVSTDVDTPVAIQLSGSDPDGDALLIGPFSLPSNGTLTGSSPNYIYTPNAGFSGTDSFGFAVLDASLSDTGTVTITVGAGGPVGGDDTLEVTRADHRSRRARWRVEGTSTVTSGNVVTIYSGSTPGGVVVGIADVQSDGSWSFRQRNSPVPTASTITAVSSAGGAVTSAVIQR